MSLYLLAEGRSEKPWGRGKGRRAPKRGWMASGTGEDWRSCCSHAQGPNLGGSGRPAAPLRSTSPLVALLRVSAVLPRLTSCGAAKPAGRARAWGSLGHPESASRSRAHVLLGRSHLRSQAIAARDRQRGNKRPRSGCRARGGLSRSPTARSAGAQTAPCAGPGRDACRRSDI